MRDSGVADQCSGLHLFHQRAGGGPSHQEEQTGVGEGHGRLRHEFRRGPVLAVGVRDVEPHASRTGRAHLQVEVRPRRSQRPIEDQHMPDELRHRLGQDQPLDVALEIAPLLRPPLARLVLEAVLHDLGRGVDVLIADGRCRVDGIDDNVRSVRSEQRREARALIRLIEGTEHIGKDPVAVGGVVEQFRPIPPAILVPEEHVAPLPDELDLRIEAPQGFRRARHTCLSPCHDDDALRIELGCDSFGDLDTNETPAAEHEEPTTHSHLRQPGFGDHATRHPPGQHSELPEQRRRAGAAKGSGA